MKVVDNTTEDVGNQYNLTCPICLSGKLIMIKISKPWIRLTKDGIITERCENSADNWGMNSEACCANCQWRGTVRDLNIVD